MEPIWGSLAMGAVVDVVAQVLVQGDLSVCKSLPSGRVFRMHGIQKGYERVSIMKATVNHSHLGLMLEANSNTRVLHVPALTEDDILNLVEPCSGLGALGVGAAYAGWKSILVNDVQASILQLAGDYSEATQVLGDISDDDTIWKLWNLHPRRSAMGFGFACQPFSKLGDQRGGQDDRSKSLTGGLRAAWLMHSPVIVMECVADAASSSFVRKEIQKFVQSTGYNQSDQILELSSMWPCARRRWWMVLTAGFMGKVTVPELPALPQGPTLCDLPTSCGTD